MTTDARMRRIASAPRIEILHVAECPLLDGVREIARRGLARVSCSARIEEIEGNYPSPTLLVNGIDVVSGRPVSSHAACRLDVPTEDQVVAALRAAQLGHVRAPGGSSG
jgi:hypothetical protein